METVVPLMEVVGEKLTAAQLMVVADDKVTATQLKRVVGGTATATQQMGEDLENSFLVTIQPLVMDFVNIAEHLDQT